MESVKTHIVTVLKGIIVGGTMLVPGVSGGTMAMILGVYSKLVASVSSFMKHKKASFIFLALFVLGGGIGIFAFANPLLQLINKYPKPMLFFFIGTVAGGIPLMLKEAKVKKFSWKIPVYIILGMLAVFLLSMLPTNGSGAGTDSGFLGFILLLSAGFIAAVALILPGISVSYLLLMMGLYDKTISSISEMNLPFLIPMGVGLLLGIILTTKLLETAMAKHPQPTYLIILGFMLGSVAEIFPGTPKGIEIFYCSITLLAGFGVIQAIRHFSERKTETEQYSRK